MHIVKLERDTGIEPVPSGWKPDALPIELITQNKHYGANPDAKSYFKPQSHSSINYFATSGAERLLVLSHSV